MYGFLMACGGVILAIVIVKGFWGATRVKPLEQPDNRQGCRVGADRSDASDTGGDV